MRGGAEHSEEGEGEQKKSGMGKGEKGIEAGGTSNREFTKTYSYSQFFDVMAFYAFFNVFFYCFIFCTLQKRKLKIISLII